MERPPLFRTYIQNNKLQLGDQLLLEDDELDEIALGTVSEVSQKTPVQITIQYQGQAFASEKKFCDYAIEEANKVKKRKLTGGYYSHLFVLPAGVRFSDRY
jgi:hypothetical protein